VITWKDVSSFSRGETDRTPKQWEATVGRFRLRVYRSRDYGQDTWLAYCVPNVFSDIVLRSSDIDEAKQEVVDILRGVVDEAIEEITSAE
jgi:hypothetical protein